MDGCLGACSIGDRLKFKRVGAYTYGLSPCLFITPPPEIWFKSQNGVITRESLPQWIDLESGLSSNAII